MKNDKKSVGRSIKTKGFTLVELLVVIAIIAVLTSVSVVGYAVFLDKAKNSVASQELEQVQTVLMAEGINNPVFSYDGSTMTYITDKTEEVAKTDFMDFLNEKCDGFTGTFTITEATFTAAVDDTAKNTLVIKKISYEKDDGTAVWEIGK